MSSPYEERYVRISIYVPKPLQEKRPLERLAVIAEKVDRSINYLVCKAILDFVEVHEGEEEHPF